MSSTKKRKLPTAEPPRAISAFAARRQLAAATQEDTGFGLVPAAQTAQEANLSTTVDSTGRTNMGTGKIPTEVTVDHEAAIIYAPDEVINTAIGERSMSSSIQQSIPLSTFRPTKKNYEQDQSITKLRLGPGEKLVILGEFEIAIHSGNITLLGANLAASTARYRVYAPASHSLPVIRCPASELNPAELHLFSYHSGLCRLSKLSPLFGRLWHDKGGPLPSSLVHSLSSKTVNIRSSFQILSSNMDGPKKTFVQPIVSPPQWNEKLATLSSSTSEHPPKIMICGPKSSGKSTFSKLLMNRFLSKKMGSEGVLWLDLDPGQPEYSPPGHLSLLLVRDLNLGPAFTHPHSRRSANRVLRAHSIAATSPASDPSFYTNCMLDLLSCYQEFVSTTTRCPLIMNTPGWILGTGLEILLTLINQAQPSAVVYMSQDGPVEVVDALREAASKTAFWTLPSHQSDNMTRTASQLRTMQVISYFHCERRDASRRSWNADPLVSIPPQRVKYFGEGAGILGILALGEQPPSDLICEVVNGSLVSIVVLDSVEAIQRSLAIAFEETAPLELDVKGGTDSVSTGESNLRALQSFITHSDKENLPYFDPAALVTLNPEHSWTLGQALVRGIDTARHELHLLTPIPASEIQEILAEGKAIILVSGRLDAPGWAYIEDLNMQTASKRPGAKAVLRDKGVEVDDSEDLSSSEISVSLESRTDRLWVERIDGHQGRGIGSRIWRVRRDLGKRSGTD